MTIIEQSVDRVRQWILASGIPVSTIAKEAGLSGRTLKSFRDPEWNPTRATLMKIERLIPIEFEPIRSPGNSDTSDEFVCGAHPAKASARLEG